MPTITIALNKTSEEKKKQLVEKLSKEAAEITEISIDHFVVYVQEHPHENIGVGGKTLKEILG
jgi:4-oxalocrotonate tautomerase